MPDAHVDLATLAEQSGTKFILALFVDLRGKPCAKLVPVEAVDLLATDGVAGEANTFGGEEVDGLDRYQLRARLTAQVDEQREDELRP